MQQWKSVDEILDFAIGQEEQAAQFYTSLAGRMDRPWMSQIFKDFAKEEMWHKTKLVEIKSGKRLMAAEVLAICISERMPSCMRAPPEAANRMNGVSRLTAARTADSRPVSRSTAATSSAPPSSSRRSGARAAACGVSRRFSSWPTARPPSSSRGRAT